MKGTVLIVDDSATLRMLMRATLRMSGFEVVDASNGQEALAILDHTPIVAVITDLNMPLMNGLDLTRAIRSRVDHARTPIFVLTVEAGATQREQCRQAGVTGWITKPIDAKQLVASLQGMLK